MNTLENIMRKIHYQYNLKHQKRKSKESYQRNPGPQKQMSLNQYFENRDAILHSMKDMFLRFQLSDKNLDIALDKENVRLLTV